VGPDPVVANPDLRLLAAKRAVVGRRAARAAAALAHTPGLSCDLVEETSVPGGGSLPLASLPTVALRVRAARRSARELARACLAQCPPLVGRIRDDAFVLDFRTVEAREVDVLVAALQAAVAT
jgi:L-seryl-tRNA(Ser) seleniumtransferase